MLKKLQKTFAMALILVMLMATTCFAEDTDVILYSETPEEATTSAEDENLNAEINESEDSDESANQEEVVEETPEEEEEMLQSDLYLFQTTIDYSRIVDGNAYIMGNDVTLSSIVGGDVFILGNNVTITEDSVIYGNLYVLGNNVTLNGFVYGGDLYAACSELTIAENAGIKRDIRVTASKITFNGGTGRNVFIAAGEIEVGENAQIYGDFNYSSRDAIQVPSGVVQGTINYSEFNVDVEEDTNPVLSYIMDFVYTLVYTLAILGVMILVAPKFLNKLENVESKKILPACGFGLLAVILPIPVAILLCLTYIGAPIGLALIAVWALLVFILAIPVATITIAGFVANKIPALHKAHNLCAVVLTTLALWALELIPFVGGIISFLVCIFGLGLILKNILRNRKNVEE